MSTNSPQLTSPAQPRLSFSGGNFFGPTTPVGSGSSQPTTASPLHIGRKVSGSWSGTSPPTKAPTSLCLPMRTPIVLPTAQEPPRWREVITDTVMSLLEERPVKHSLEAVYRTLEDVRRHVPTGHSELTRLLTTMLSEHCPKVFLYQGSLQAMANIWERHRMHVKLLGLLFTTHDVETMSLDALKGLPSIFAEALTRMLAEGVMAIRCGGGNGDATSVASVQRLVTVLGFYVTVYKEILTSNCVEYYTRKASEETLGPRLDLGAYMTDVVVPAIDLEANLLGSYLPCPSELSPAQSLLCHAQQCLLWNIWDIHILESLSALFLIPSPLSLGRLYRCASENPVRNEQLRGVWRSYLASSIGALCTTVPAVSISDLLQLLEVQTKGCMECFANHALYQQTLRETFEKVLGSHIDVVSKFLGMFYDRTLSTATSSETAQSDDALPLLKLLPSKDVFEVYYKVLLAKRLLLMRSQGPEAERDTILRFRSELGTGFTQKAENMLRDSELSRELMSSFEESGMLHVNVLADGTWPTMGLTWERLPTELTERQTTFEKFYKAKHQNRTLAWKHILSTIVLKYIPCKKELVMSLAQGLVLLQFDDETTTTLTEDEIISRVMLPSSPNTAHAPSSGPPQTGPLLLGLSHYESVPREVTAICESLVAAKLLLPGFSLNMSYTNKQTKIRIPPHKAEKNQASSGKASREDAAISHAVAQDRMYALDATIVRLMKSRRKIVHQELFTSVVGMCRFSVQPAELKKRIESLIDRDFIKRDETEPSVYHYVS